MTDYRRERRERFAPVMMHWLLAHPGSSGPGPEIIEHMIDAAYALDAALAEREEQETPATPAPDWRGMLEDIVRTDASPRLSLTPGTRLADAVDRAREALEKHP